MHVYLLRHGQAADAAIGQPDEERALTEEGVERLERASPAWRCAIGGVDALHASPLLRAQQTAAILAHALHHRHAVRTEAALVPGARPQAAVELLQAALLEGRKAVALVGHEPHLGALLALLVTGSDRLALPLKKGMLVGVDVESATTMLGRLVLVLGQRTAGDLA